MRDITDPDTIPREGLGLVPTNFTTQGPKTVPRVDYERVFILDPEMKLLGEYALRDDCPLEYEDLRRSIPLSGMRHLLSFYQGEYVFTPFRVEDLWFVVLTHGVPRIEERGSIGTLLAAMRAHLPARLAPALAEKDAALRDLAQDVERRESLVGLREQRVTQLEADLLVAGKKLKELESDVRARETRLNALRDYAIQMQRAFRQRRQASGGSEENPPPPEVYGPPPP